MVVIKYEVIKKPRDGSIPDKAPNFPPLTNLHLELLENKKKLKPGLPPIVIVRKPTKPIVKQPPPPQKEERVEIEEPPKDGSAPKEMVIGDSDTESVKEKSESKPKKEKTKVVSESKKVETKKKEEVVEPDSDDDLVNELKSDDEKDEEESVKSGEEAEGEDESPEQDDDKAEEETKVEDDPYAHLSPEEREAAEKEEYIWRYKILRRKYKSRSDIPEYNEHSDLPTMKRTYDRLVKDIHLDSSVDSLRSYLVGGFMLVEYVCSDIMDLDFKGFAKVQVKMMSKYEELLIELGEKSYVSIGSKLPVELKLIGYIVFNALAFYLIRMLAKKGNGSMALLVKGFTGISDFDEDDKEEKSEAPARKMRGPGLKAEDVKKMAT
jgi:hypothetical protein